MKIELTRIHVFSSVRASLPIWASETSLARARASGEAQIGELARRLRFQRRFRCRRRPRILRSLMTVVRREKLSLAV